MPGTRRRAGLHFGHVGDLGAVRRSLVEVLAQLAQQDEQFVWKRVAAMRAREEDLRRPPFRPPARWAGMAAGNGLAETTQLRSLGGRAMKLENVKVGETYTLKVGKNAGRR